MKKILIILVIILGSCLAAAVTECRTERLKYSNAMETIKAYDTQLDTTKASNRVYKMTVDQLKHSMDSSFREMESLRRQLKIKKKDV